MTCNLSENLQSFFQEDIFLKLVIMQQNVDTKCDFDLYLIMS